MENSDPLVTSSASTEDSSPLITSFSSMEDPNPLNPPTSSHPGTLLDSPEPPDPSTSLATPNTPSTPSLTPCNDAIPISYTGMILSRPIHPSIHPVRTIIHRVPIHPIHPIPPKFNIPPQTIPTAQIPSFIPFIPKTQPPLSVRA
jgi:hypothetical protein